MLDAGHVAAPGSFAAALCLPQQQVALWHCQLLLDRAQPGAGQDASLAQACALLAKHAGGRTGLLGPGPGLGLGEAPAAAAAGC
jgi:hypothetical protein